MNYSKFTHELAMEEGLIELALFDDTKKKVADILAEKKNLASGLPYYSIETDNNSIFTLGGKNFDLLVELLQRFITHIQESDISDFQVRITGLKEDVGGILLGRLKEENYADYGKASDKFLMIGCGEQ